MTSIDTIDNTRVAATILGQLGGKRFLAMTGATNLLGGADSLTMKLPRGVTRDGITHLRVILRPDDTYTLEWFNIRRAAIQAVATDERVYADNLRAHFTQRTGLDVTL
jgi:hypothetical protein